MAINVTANWRLIRSMDPLLRMAEKGRALFMTSGAAHNFYAYWGAYAVSKSALEAMVKTYAAETQTLPLRANLLSPGPIRTKMRAQAMPGEDPLTLPTPEELVAASIGLFGADVTETGAVFQFDRNSKTIAKKA